MPSDFGGSKPFPYGNAIRFRREQAPPLRGNAIRFRLEQAPALHNKNGHCEVSVFVLFGVILGLFCDTGQVFSLTFVKKGEVARLIGRVCKSVVGTLNKQECALGFCSGVKAYRHIGGDEGIPRTVDIGDGNTGVFYRLDG